MNYTTIIKMSIAVIIAAMLMVSIVAPLVDSASKETTTITNEGAGWAKYAYIDEATDYNVSLASDGTTLTMGTQSGTADDMIAWASDEAAVIHDGGDFTLLYQNGDDMAAVDLGASATVASSAGTVTISDSTSTAVYTSDSLEWTYTPDAAGVFGFFTSSGATVKDFPVAAAGSFAGAYAYNEINSVGHSTLAPTYSVADDVFTTGPWTVPDLDAKSKVVKILPVVDVKEKITDNEIAIKAITTPTPDYTDGDWGYNLDGSNAIIVSYSGAGGNINVPATVGANNYSVVQLGINNYQQPIMSDSSISANSTLTIPDSVTIIGSGALRGCSKLTGSLTIPDSVTSIGAYAFYGCNFTGSLTIPDSVTSIGHFAFQSCTGFTGSLTIPDSVTSIGISAFQECTGFTGSLTISDSVTSIGDATFYGCNFTGSLTIPDSVTSINSAAFYNTDFDSLVVVGSPAIGSTSFKGAAIENVLNLGSTAISGGNYGLSADIVVSDEIPSLGYLAPVSYSATVAKEGMVYSIMAILPVIMLAGVLVMTAAAFISNRRA